MSIINFTNKTCKTEKELIETLTNNFEKHLAIYSLNKIKEFPNVELDKGDSSRYNIKCNSKKAKDIIDTLSSFKCSHFDTTLVPVFTEIEDGLQVDFKIDGEC